MLITTWRVAATTLVRIYLNPALLEFVFVDVVPKWASLNVNGVSPLVNPAVDAPCSEKGWHYSALRRL